ncbi:MAG: o-succinylbenzoate synthase [Ignavibacteria bacterium]|nr:o-succinylbenzoate synthase [Ignavibacteria bacterium]
MKVERITLTHVRIPLVEPFRISSGEISEKDGIVVALYGDGVVGYGESSPMSGSFYSEETPESAWDCLVNELIPQVLKTRPASLERVNDLTAQIVGNQFAKAGIESAFWDLEAQQRNEPLWKTLGGKRTQVESGLAVGIFPTISKLLSAIERYLMEGYRRVKIKIQPGWDIEPLLAVRGEFGRIPLMVDANCAYRQSDLDHLQALDDFELMMIEQPLPKPDLEGHAKLQAMMKTPICLDESAKDATAVRKAIEMRSCSIINIKIQRVGGLKNAVEMHDICRAAGVPVWAGTMPELGIGSAQSVHLATLENFGFPTDVESSLRWFVDDVIYPFIEVRNGVIEIPEGVGNCYRVDGRKMQKYKVREESFR